MAAPPPPRGLADLAALPSLEAKAAAYAAHLDAALEEASAATASAAAGASGPAAGSVATAYALLAHLADPDAVTLSLSRSLLSAFAAKLETLATVSRDAAKLLAKEALERIGPRRVSFEEQLASIREALAGMHEADEEWADAARCLAGIDLDSGVRAVDDDYKLATCVRIAMLYLEDDDAVNAETHVKRASFLLASRDNDVAAAAGADDAKYRALELQYKVCYARVLDAKRRFLEAAMRYYELSQLPSTGGGAAGTPRVDDAELVQALEAAVACAVLAAAGPQRSRVLATLYKDERTSRLPSFAILERVHLGRFLQPDAVAAFAATLKPHQLAQAADGSTVLSRSVVEHNIVAASMVYRCIALDALGALLGVAPRVAEKAAGTMIFERRLNAHLDQAAGVLRFDHDDGAKASWDSTIANLCGATTAIVASLDPL